MKSFIFLLMIVAMSSASDRVNVVDNADQVKVANNPAHDGGAITNPLDPAFSRPTANYPGVQFPSAGDGLYYPPQSYYDRGTVSGQNVPKYQVKPPGWDKKYSFPGARDGGR